MSAADALAARIAAAAPAFAGIAAEIAARAAPMRAPHGARLFGPGDPCRAYVIPLSGAVRVEHVGESGRTVVLYRVEPGDSCVMTTSCLLSGACYEAWGWAEGELEAVAVPPEAFRTLLGGSPAFRDLAFGVFSRRLLELVEVIDELLARRLDLRLAGWLAERGAAGPVEATHQAIAAEFGTAREVVSRILKDFERRGWVETGRGRITVRDRAALARHGDARGA